MEEPSKFPILDSVHLPGFTPVRRPQLNILGNTPAGPHDVAWTSTRCSRLLRPISSRITQLRKQRIIQELPVPTVPSIAEPKRTLQQIPNQTNDGDLDWDPDDRPKKKPRRTYSSKNSSTQITKKPTNSTFDDLLINAPVSATSQTLAQVDDDDHLELSQDLSDVAEESREDRVRRRQYRTKTQDPRHKFRQLAKTVTPVDWMLYDGLYSSLDHLLKFTAKARPRPHHGTNSLFSTCLKTIPRLIAEEQKAEDQKEPEVCEDVSKSIYEDLESYGSVSDAGWKPLREVVRAHGIALIGDAIENGLITPSIARGLVILCLQSCAFEEAESLCWSLLRTLPPISTPRSSCSRLFGPETSIALKTLRDMTTQSRRWNFFFRSLTTLIDTGIVPVEWMAREEMVDCWNEAFLSSAEGCGVSASAMSLVQKVITLAYQAPKVDTEVLTHELRLRSHDARKATSNKSTRRVTKPRVVYPLLRHANTPEGTGNSTTTIVSNLISILLAVNCSRDDGSAPPAFWLDVLHAVFIDYAAKQELHILSRDSRLVATNAEVPAILSFAFILLPFIVHDSSFTDSMPEIASRSTLGNSDSPNACEALATLLRAIATCWSRLCCTEPFDLLRQLVDHCLSLASTDDMKKSAKLLCKLSTSAAIEFAEGSKDNTHLDWALEVEERADGIEITNTHKGRTSHTTADLKAANELQYRWDDSICEWIAKTPLPSKQRNEPIPPSSFNDTIASPTSTIPRYSRELIPRVPVWSSFCKSTVTSDASEPTTPESARTTDNAVNRTVELQNKPCPQSDGSDQGILREAQAHSPEIPLDKSTNVIPFSRTAVVQIPIYTDYVPEVSKEDWSEDDELCHNNNTRPQDIPQSGIRAGALRSGVSNAVNGTRRVGCVGEASRSFRSRANYSLTKKSIRNGGMRTKFTESNTNYFSEDELAL